MRSALTDALLQLFETHYRKLSIIVTLVTVFKSRLKTFLFFPGFLSSLSSIAHCLAPAPLKLRPYDAIQIRLLLLIFISHQHKAAGRKTRLDIQNYGCVATAIYSVTMVWKETDSSLQSHGKALMSVANVVSRVFSVIVVIRLPISCVSSMAISCHVPAVSTANG